MSTQDKPMQVDFPSESSLNGMFLNVDLIGQTPLYLHHLDAWREFPKHCGNMAFVRRCLWRYECLWLPLLHKYETGIEPPTDVHWMWHLHLLQPCKYVVYCKKHYNQILHHKFPRSKSESKSIKNRTRQIWDTLYPEEPFELNLPQLLSTTNPTALYSFLELEYLLHIGDSEKDFNYRCQLPHFRDQSYQLSAVQRYKQFLFLKQSCPHWNPCRHPTDLELIWRVHLMHPSQYISDILRIIDNNPNDTNFESYSLKQILNQAQKDLYPNLIHENQFWNYFYPDDESSFFVNGSIPMVCDNSSSASDNKHTLRMFSSTSSDQDNIKECNIIFNGLNISDLWSRHKNVKVIASLLGTNSFQQHVIFQVKEVAKWTFQDLRKKLLKFEKTQYLGECKFVRGENRGIELEVYVGGGVGVFKRYKKVARKTFNPMHYLSNPQSPHQTVHALSTVRIYQEIDIPKVTYTDPNISINYTLEFPERNTFTFVLDRNKPEASEIPYYLKSYLKNIYSWQIAINDYEEQKQFMVARHSIKCREHGVAFGVEIVRHDRYNLNAILLFQNNVNLVAVAFSIDSGYLPSSAQVMETCPLTKNSTDVAMAVQMANEEDCIIVASFKEECSKGEGTILFTTYNIQDRRLTRVEVRADEMRCISNGTASVDLPSGRIVVKDKPQLIPQHISWLFSVGCLFLSIQNNIGFNGIFGINAAHSSVNSLFSGSVRSSSTQLSMGTEDSNSIGKSRSKERLSLVKMRKNRRQLKRRKMSTSFTFLLACGLSVDSSVNRVSVHL